MRGKRVEVVGQRCEQHLGAVGNREPGTPGKLGRGLAQGGHVDVIAIKGERGELVDLLGVQHPGAEPLELGDDRVIDRGVDHARLLRRADHRAVERLRDEDVNRGASDVGAAMQVDGRIPGSHGDARFAGRLRVGDDLGATRGPDEVDARVPEVVVCDLVVGVGDDLQGARRHPGGLTGLAEDLHDACPASERIRRRTEDDGVPGLGGDDRLEQHRRGGVRDRRDGEDDADRFGDVRDAVRGVLVDDPDRPLVLEVVGEEFGRDEVLDDLVFEHAEAGLLDGERSELDRRFQSGDHHGRDDGVDLLLIQQPECPCCLARSIHKGVELADTCRIERFGSCHCHGGHPSPPSAASGAVKIISSPRIWVGVPANSVN